MSYISLSKIQNVLPEFVQTRLIPGAPDWLQWAYAAATPLALANADKVIDRYLPAAQAVGLVDDQKRLDIDKARDCITRGFAQSKLTMLNGLVTLTKEDGDALIGLLDKYKD